MNKTKFIKVKKTKNYTVINNEILKRDDISWKAKGIMCYVLSLPEDWTINLNEIMQNATEGKAAFRSGWKELVDLGYVERKPVYKDGLIDFWETTVWESLELKETQLLTDYLEVENLEVENLEVDNRKLLSTNNTKYLNKQSTKYIVEVVEYLNAKANKKYKADTNSTKYYIKARLNEGFTVDDLKKVIDIKTREWINDKKMCKYLRPQTLFGTKFEGYLNQEYQNKEDKEMEELKIGYNY